LAQALILLEESRHGHPTHKWLAIGHLAEAASEIESYDVTIYGMIREARKNVEEHGVCDIMEILEALEAVTKYLETQ